MPGAASGHSLSAILALFVRDRAGWIQQNPFKTGLKQQNPPLSRTVPKCRNQDPIKSGVSWIDRESLANVLCSAAISLQVAAQNRTHAISMLYGGARGRILRDAATPAAVQRRA
jgi:hypothetical protein